tara:strand:+ start:240 stop:545 length:306 start_codon:yes stop_codon:yes gene_type:complete
MEIIKLVVRVFENKDDCEMFSAVLEKKLPDLLVSHKDARYRIIMNTEQPNVLIILWEFMSSKTHEQVKIIVKKNIDTYLAHLKHKKIDYTGNTANDSKATS